MTIIYGGGTGAPITTIPVGTTSQPYPGVLYTHVSLNHYAKILGINPAHFNGADQVNLPNGKILYKLDNAQNNIWPQYSHQAYDQISRDELVREIYSAEQEIEEVLGYHIAPDFDESDIYSLQDYYRPDLAGSVVVTRGNEFVFNLRRQKFIGAGMRKLTHLGSLAVTYTDDDLDGFKETGSVTIDITLVASAAFDITKIKLFYTGTSGMREYEIRPSRERNRSGNTVTVKFDSVTLVDPILQRRIADDEYGWIVDASDTDNLIQAMDVYYEELDNTLWSCKFSKTNTDTLAVEEVTGLTILRKADPVTVGVIPADYTGGAWQKTSCGEVDYYDYVTLRYLSGASASGILNVSMGHNVPEDLARAVCYLATARLPRIFYANNNATSLADHLREDYAFNDQGQARFLTRDDGYNPFGTKYGEIMAWRLITKLVHMQTTGVAL